VDKDKAMSCIQKRTEAIQQNKRQPHNQVRNIYFLFDFIMGGLLSLPIKFTSCLLIWL
jgi:hypothetical protein